jgi:FlaA1/EpsC-like NDP-sugar epimerase
MGSYTSFLLHLRNRHFLVLDLFVFLLTPVLALALRVDNSTDIAHYMASLLLVMLLFPAIKLPVFYTAGMYRRLWRYAGIDDLIYIALLSLVGLGLQTLVFLLLRSVGWLAPDFPRSLPVLDGMLALLAVGGIRLSVPFSRRALKRQAGRSPQNRVVVIGAGSAGAMIVRELQTNSAHGLLPVAFLDDDPLKQGKRLCNIPVLGSCREIADVVLRMCAKQVIIAMPSAPGRAIREIVERCEAAGVPTKIMPGLAELIDGKSSVNQLRDIDIQDLLRREPIRTDVTAVGDLVRGKCVLITGGGGSIGSELCRQILRFGPRMLILMGHGENSIFEIYNELLRLPDSRALPGNDELNPPITRLIPVIADIRFADRVMHVFAEYRPEIVFHAAAHKHVPLMEDHPVEAITNNVMGTKNLLLAARSIGVERFVMISSDKAVNPTSVMGASKRVAELLVHQAAQESGRPYMAVRFGNVLGSRGSVVLTFRQQIAAGGPLTVTHPDMTRFFMTIPEAVQLLLQAAVLGRGGEVFTLDMGEPLKIVDLAHDLVRLSGLEVGRDIEIVFSGMRPGEKLYEELFVPGECYERTHHQKIFIAANASTFVPHNLDQALAALAQAAAHNDGSAIVRELQALISEFQPVGHSPQGIGKNRAPLQPAEAGDKGPIVSTENTLPGNLPPIGAVLLAE